MCDLRYGLVGCGMMGQEHIMNIDLLEGAKIAAICDPDASMRERGAQLAPEAQIFDQLEPLLETGDLDCLVIASPNFLHADQLRMIASRCPLPLLVEKPLATRPEDEAFIEELGKTYPEPVWVAMEYRYMPPIAKFIELAEDITGGIKMLTIREHRFPFLEKVGNWNRFNEFSGGTLVEKCCHFFDLMRFILKSEPVRIMASAGQSWNHLDETYDGYTPDIWDNAYVIADFKNGARAMLELCMFAEGARYQEEITAVGPNGKIECLVPGPGRFWPETLGPLPTPQLIVSPREPRNPHNLEIPVDPQLLAAGDHNGATYYQHRKFLDVIRNGAQPEVSLQDGWKAVAMGMAAQQSASSGEAVKMK